MERNFGTDIDSIREYVHGEFPDYTVVLINDLENEEHQSYRFLYEELCARLAQSQSKIEELEAEMFSQRADLENRDREIAFLNSKVENLELTNIRLKDSSLDYIEIIDKFTSEEITVSVPSVYDREGKKIEPLPYCETPAVYQYHRPSWFSPLAPELSKENAAAHMADKTASGLKDRLIFWNNILERFHAGADKNLLAQEVDRKRSDDINNLIKSNISNEEKYVKYIMLTPGIPKDYLNTLMGAADLGLDATVVIRLLEQPAELFNREVFEAYVSRVHKGSEYNLKQELAEELIRDEWSIHANVNGKEEVFKLVPYQMLTDLLDRLTAIKQNLEGCDKQNEPGGKFAAEPCAEMAQGSAEEENFFENEEPLIELDDSMIDMI